MRWGEVENRCANSSKEILYGDIPFDCVGDPTYGGNTPWGVKGGNGTGVAMTSGDKYSSERVCDT